MLVPFPVYAALSSLVISANAFTAPDDNQVNGNPVHSGFTGIVLDGIRRFGSGFGPLDLWDITAYSATTAGSQRALDFEGQVSIRVEAKQSHHIFETHNFQMANDWSPISPQGPPQGLPKHPWTWSSIRVPFEDAIVWSQAGPGDREDWTKVILSISLSERQLASGEPIWKFYKDQNYWIIGVGAISGKLIYGSGPLLNNTAEAGVANPVFNNTLFETS